MITIVIPWYGPDTAGGAETQARSLAQALHRIGVEVRVWASTGRDSFHPDDQNYYPAGDSELDDIPIWRFVPSTTDEHGVPHFFCRHPERLPPLDSFLTRVGIEPPIRQERQDLNERMRKSLHMMCESEPYLPLKVDRFPVHEMQLLGSLLSSDELYARIVAESHTSQFMFMPYPFPTTFWGALLAPERSFLLPCLHDEPYAYYHTYAYLFSQVRGILCNSVPEAHLVRRLYDTVPEERIHVPGEGIDLTPRGNGQLFRERFFATHPCGGQEPALLLYVGRRDESKNITQLLVYMREYWARRRIPLRLLLAGRDALRLPPALGDLLVDVGYLDEQEKHDAYAAADVFVQPSLYESFSIVLMEAWLQGTPALVHGNCNVTTYHCEQSGGGLTCTDFGTFAAALDILLTRPDLRETLGQRGQAYVMDVCNWETVARLTAGAVLGSN